MIPAVAILSLGFLCAAAHGADPPRLDWLFPTGGQQGATVELTVGGNVKPWPVRVWTDAPGVMLEAAKDEGKLTAEIAKDTPVGVYHVRLATDQGASWPRWFVVGHVPEILEAESNDDFRAEAQALEKLPVTINGKLEKSGGDTDSFAVSLKAGQWLVAAAESYTIGAPVDPSLQVVDERGTVLAFNNDDGGLDPTVNFQAPKGGRYVVQIFGFAEPRRADVAFMSHPSAVYRLTVTTGPFVDYGFPAGLRRGSRRPVHLYGWNLGTTGQAIVHVVDARTLAGRARDLTVHIPEAANRLTLAVGDAPESLEVEPNDSADLAYLLTMPCVMNGRVGRAGDVDRYRFEARKGQRFNLTLRAGSLGFALDTVLAIEDSAGKELVRNDDSAGQGDPKLAWTAPADGSYVAVVRDLFDRGGPDCVYRLEIAEPRPDFAVTADDNVYRVVAGESTEMTATVSLIDGYTGEINVMLEDLPAGVTATVGQAPTKGGGVKLTLSAAEKAEPAGGPVRLIAVDAKADPPRVRVGTGPIRATTDPKAGPIDKTQHLWVALAPKPPPPKPREEEKKK